MAIQHLAALAGVTASPLTGGTLAGMVTAYIEGGRRADAAVLDALAAVTKPADIEAVSTAVSQFTSPGSAMPPIVPETDERKPAPRS